MSTSSVKEIDPMIYRKSIQTAMERSKTFGLEARLKSMGKEKDDPKDKAAVARAVTKFFGIYYAVMDTMIQNDMFGSTSIPIEGNELLNLYAMYIGAVKSREDLDEKRMTGSNFDLDLRAMSLDTRNPANYDSALDEVIKDIAKETAVPESARQKKVRMNSVLKKIEMDIGNYIATRGGKFDSFMRALEEVNLKVNGTVFTGFNQRKTNYLPVAREISSDVPTIFGNDEAIKVIDRFVNIVSLFNPRTQKNMYFHGWKRVRPLSFFMAGKPGVGKSLLISYAEAKLQRIASLKGMEYNPQIIDNTFKDMWHGKDIQNLEALFKSVQDTTKLASLSIDDGESVFGRRDNQDSKIERGNIQHLLGFLNGLKTDYKGNFIHLFATNLPDQIDPALMSRYQRKAVLTGPHTSEHYSLLFKTAMGEDYGSVQINDSGLTKFGNMCEKYEFSGREVDNIVTRLKDQVKNPDAITEEMALMEDDTQILAALQGISRTIRPKDLRAEIEYERDALVDMQETYM